MTMLRAAPLAETEKSAGPDSGVFAAVRFEDFAADDRPPSVLIVDDYAECAESAAALLELCGYVVRTATTAAAAEELVWDTRPDVVVLDPRLPCGGGRDLVRRLRAAVAPRPLKVVVHTYCTLIDTPAESLHGGDLLLPKPADPRALLDALARLTGGPGAV